VAQLVEHHLAKVGVAGSNPVVRSTPGSGHMRRHDALIPLTHDHHHALARARRLRLAAASAHPEEQRDAAEEFVEFFQQDSVLHFREEEEILFPLVIDRTDTPIDLLARLLLDHVRMHRLVGTLRAELEEGEPRPDTLHTIGEVLAEHIRAEESQLFPIIQQLVSEEDLHSIALAPRVRKPPPR
jgi:hemerythrin-like domain-containing protein